MTLNKCSLTDFAFFVKGVQKLCDIQIYSIPKYILKSLYDLWTEWAMIIAYEVLLDYLLIAFKYNFRKELTQDRLINYILG